jgi:hypothetical protein
MSKFSNGHGNVSEMRDLLKVLKKKLRFSLIFAVFFRTIYVKDLIGKVRYALQFGPHFRVL